MTTVYRRWGLMREEPQTMLGPGLYSSAGRISSQYVWGTIYTLTLMKYS
jgi:hypothetical protein